MITQAVILSAGFGTRLKPLTDTMPKVMIPFFGKPLLEHHILQLKKHGVSELFINLHYLPDVVTNYFGDGSKWGVKIMYALESPKILGTAGGVKNFDGKLKGAFFVIYGDVFSLVDYTKMAAAWEKHPDAIGMEVVGMNDHPHDSDLVTVDKDLRFVALHLKPNKELPPNFKTMRALFIMHERILKYIPANTYYENEKMLMPDVLAKGEPYYGYDCGDDYLKDAGTMERYQQVTEHLKKIGYQI